MFNAIEHLAHYHPAICFGRMGRANLEAFEETERPPSPGTGGYEPDGALWSIGHVVVAAMLLAIGGLLIV